MIALAENNNEKKIKKNGLRACVRLLRNFGTYSLGFIENNVYSRVAITSTDDVQRYRMGWYVVGSDAVREWALKWLFPESTGHTINPFARRCWYIRGRHTVQEIISRLHVQCEFFSREFLTD